MRYPVLGSAATLSIARPADYGDPYRPHRQTDRTHRPGILPVCRARSDEPFPPSHLLDGFSHAVDIIGVGSLPIVILSGFFTGGVLSLQSLATLSAFGATAITGQFVSLTMIRELGAAKSISSGSDGYMKSVELLFLVAVVVIILASLRLSYDSSNCWTFIVRRFGNIVVTQ